MDDDQKDVTGRQRQLSLREESAGRRDARKRERRSLATSETTVGPDRSGDTARFNAELASMDEIDQKKVAQLALVLRNGHALGKVPLFVLGAGISAGQVPLLSQIADWFQDTLLSDDRTRTMLGKLSSGRATRADAAELFSTLQSETNSALWLRFSKSFLLGEAPRLKIQTGDFQGLASAESTPAHLYLAKLLQARLAHVLSLNFDGLTIRALTKIGSSGVALHNEKQVRAYFCATEGTFHPAVIKVRGDVFYARCTNPLCPASKEEYPLDRLPPRKETQLRCSACSQDTVALQFSFPGFRIKEETAYPILREAMRFLAQRLSGIIILGLSGKWDSYLLDFLFHQAVERELPIFDVKPSGDDDSVLSSFRAAYYPSCLEVSNGETLASSKVAFVRIRKNADAFCAELESIGW